MTVYEQNTRLLCVDDINLSETRKITKGKIYKVQETYDDSFSLFSLVTIQDDNHVEQTYNFNRFVVVENDLMSEISEPLFFDSDKYPPRFRIGDKVVLHSALGFEIWSKYSSFLRNSNDKEKLHKTFVVRFSQQRSNDLIWNRHLEPTDNFKYDNIYMYWLTDESDGTKIIWGVPEPFLQAYTSNNIVDEIGFSTTLKTNTNWGMF